MLVHQAREANTPWAPPMGGDSSCLAAPSTSGAFRFYYFYFYSSRRRGLALHGGEP